MSSDFDIKTLSIPELLEHPYVQELHEVIHILHAENEALKVEFRKFKKLPAKPTVKPSKLDEVPPTNSDATTDTTTANDATTDASEPNDKSTDKPKDTPKRAGSQKRSKTKDLVIHQQKECQVIAPDPTWTFLGYKDYVVQGLKIELHNTCYKREEWETPDGKYIIAPLPESLQNTHFSAPLRSFILYQYNQCCVTQPLLLEELREYGIKISAGQLSNILTQKIDVFHHEATDILIAGLNLFPEIRTDDTPAPHKGNSGYCNCINTDYFTYFKSTDTKSRINFLEILSAGNPSYILDAEALSCLEENKLPKKYFPLLDFSDDNVFTDKEEWNQYLKDKEIVPTSKPHVYKKITEAALISGLISKGFNTDIVVHSDDAGQFKLFVNSLCWKHAERPLLKLVCYVPYQQNILDSKLLDFWNLYRDLKSYKITPESFKKQDLLDRFDKICEPVDEGFDFINPLLKHLAKKKDELMLVIERPYTSLENNPSERDIREFAKRRKVNGPTKNNDGRKARDTFASLKKTCRKLKISFLKYLNDRNSGENNIPKIAQIITEKYLENSVAPRAK